MAIEAPAPDWVERHKQVWREKAVLRGFYEREYFRRLVAEMPHGRSLELGAGPGFFAAYKRCDVVSDITPAPHVDRVVDVHEMPFDAESFDCVVGLDVVHHFARPSQAFTEVARVLRPGGRVVLIEPWTGVLGYLFCRYIHHEDCFSIPDPWGRVFPEGKDPMEGNATIPKTYFYDHAAGLESRTGLRVVKIEAFSFFGYIATGGFTRFAMPQPLADMVAAVERSLPRWFWRHCAVKALIVAEKT